MNSLALPDVGKTWFLPLKVQTAVIEDVVCASNTKGMVCQGFHVCAVLMVFSARSSFTRILATSLKRILNPVVYQYIVVLKKHCAGQNMP